MTDPPRTVYDDAIAILKSGDVQLLTSDVFDTLVWRPVAEPYHLFGTLGASLIAERLLPAHVSRADFLGWRRLAERLAREAAQRCHGAAECSLEEIWSRLPDPWRLGAPGRYVELELETERLALRPISAGCDVLETAAALGIAVVLISDTYLSVEQVSTLLRSVGVPLDGVDAVVTSSEERLNKSSGLIDAVIAGRGLAPSRTLHLGDHPSADIVAAERAGARAIRVDADDPAWSSTPMGLALHDLSRRTGSDGGARGLSRALRLADGAGSSGPRPAHAAAYDFGVTVGGPLLAGFADWLVERCEQLAVGRVHYLLREGAFLSEVVGAARPDKAPEARLVHASRWVTTRASVFDGTADEIGRALARRARFRPAHVTDAFGLDPSLVRSVVGDHELDDEQRQLAMEALASDERTRTAIVDASADLRRRLMRLYEREVQPDGGRLVVCDIGWGGSIQSATEEILAREGWEVDVFGLYLMLSQPGLDRVRLGSRMEGFLPADHPHERRALVVMRTAEISEQLCTTERQTFVDVDAAGGPMLAAVDAVISPSRRRAQRGVLDFALARPAALAATPELLGDVAAALLDGFSGTIERPDRRTAEELGTWTHDDIAGTGSEPLIDPEFAPLLRFANAARAGLVTMRDLYWLQGSAALASHSLAAEIAAVDLGIDPEDLCPPSEIGSALIAVFQDGEVDAVAQIRIDPHRNAEGWSLMRLTANASSIRDIRFDVGEIAAFVELGVLAVRVGDTAIEITDMSDARLTWVDAYPVSPKRLVALPGGYFTLSFAGVPVDYRRDGVVDAVFAFRGVALSDVERAHFRPPMRHRARRVFRRARRRIGRS